MSVFRKWAMRRAKARADHHSDGMILVGRNVSFLKDPKFVAAWDACKLANAGMPRRLSDTRWRAWICISAAKQALRTSGDFVECGVNAGILSTAVCHYLDFNTVDRKFFLFDTFAGIPLDGISASERQHAVDLNQTHYVDCLAIAKRNFSPYRNVEIVRGVLPSTLDALDDRKISYLSIDLNSSTYEMQVIERLWDRLSVGAVVVLDDYGFIGYEAQHSAWDAFAESVCHPIFSIPTGQGIIFKN